MPMHHDTDDPRITYVEVPRPNPLGVAMLLAASMLALGGLYALAVALWP